MTAGPELRELRTSSGGNGSNPLAALRRFTREREPAERCELCSAPLAPHPRHEHLLDPAARALACACTPCALLFPPEAEKRYRRVSRRLFWLEDFTLSDAQWEALALPVGMAFLHTSSPSAEVHAYYPSPAGATESLLTLEGWGELVSANPVLERMAPDVEALLVNRVRGARDHFLAPIDRCYELVGLIRLRWRGLSGGTEMWAAVDAFFADLRDHATTRRASGDA
ncbi:MAG TPA: DUF5947 family protein [Candidatus Dormibacteraeota bacterium]